MRLNNRRLLIIMIIIGVGLYFNIQASPLITLLLGIPIGMISALFLLPFMMAPSVSVSSGHGLNFERLKDVLETQRQFGFADNRDKFCFVVRIKNEGFIPIQCYTPELILTNGKGTFRELFPAFDPLIVSDTLHPFQIHEFAIIYPKHDNDYWKPPSLGNLKSKGYYAVFRMIATANPPKRIDYTKRLSRREVSDYLVQHLNGNQPTIILESREIGEKILNMIEYQFCSRDYKDDGHGASNLLFSSIDMINDMHYNYHFCKGIPFRVQTYLRNKFRFRSK